LNLTEVSDAVALQDVANGSMILTTHLTSALNTFADHELQIRSQLKEIRTKEEQLDELRRRRKAVGSKLEAQEKRLSKMGSEVGSRCTGVWVDD